MNQVIIIGTICEEIQPIRQTQTGKQVRNVRVLTVDPPRGSFQGARAFHNVVLWGGLAEKADDFQEGDLVRVEGRLQYRNYITNDGEKRNAVDIVARTFGRPDDNEVPEIPADTPTRPQRRSEDDSDIPF